VSKWMPRLFLLVMLLVPIVIVLYFVGYAQGKV